MGLATAAIFSDHMVLQHDTKVPVWGTADPGESVTVSFKDQTKTVTAGTDGRWMIRFDAMPAEANPQRMTVKGSKKTITYQDVLIGEVWLGSGQSNMEWAWTFRDKPEVRAAQMEKKPDQGNHVDERTMQVLRRAVGNPMIRVSAKTNGLSRALHPPNKWQYAQRHLDNIFPMAYGRPAPKWFEPEPQAKTRPAAAGRPAKTTNR